MYILLVGYPPFWDEDQHRLYAQIKNGAYDVFNFILIYFSINFYFSTQVLNGIQLLQKLKILLIICSLLIPKSELQLNKHLEFHGFVYNFYHFSFFKEKAKS